MRRLRNELIIKITIYRLGVTPEIVITKKYTYILQFTEKY